MIYWYAFAACFWNPKICQNAQLYSIASLINCSSKSEFRLLCPLKCTLNQVYHPNLPSKFLYQLKYLLPSSTLGYKVLSECSTPLPCKLRTKMIIIQPDVWIWERESFHCKTVKSKVQNLHHETTQRITWAIGTGKLLWNGCIHPNSPNLVWKVGTSVQYHPDPWLQR